MFSKQVDGESHKTKYTNDHDNRVMELKCDGGADAGKTTGTYTYIDGAYGLNNATPLVKKITQNSVSFEYAYDN